MGKVTWSLLNDAWPFDQRPPKLQKRKYVYLMELQVLLALKDKIDLVQQKRNLGEEVFSKDSKPQKIRFKARSDDGVKKLHPARNLRLPLAHPKYWFKSVPKKREAIIRNFPMDHLGLTGHIADDTIGKMHNRSVKVTLDLFCKATHHEAKGNQKAGKYCIGSQIREGLNNYCLALHCLWPQDYTGLVITKVLIEADWAEQVTTDLRKRADLITEFFNAVIADNSAKAVYSMYPLIYEQVRLVHRSINLLATTWSRTII